MVRRNAQKNAKGNVGDHYKPYQVIIKDPLSCQKQNRGLFYFLRFIRILNKIL